MEAEVCLENEPDKLRHNWWDKYEYLPTMLWSALMQESMKYNGTNEILTLTGFSDFDRVLQAQHLPCSAVMHISYSLFGVGTTELSRIVNHTPERHVLHYSTSIGRVSERGLVQPS